MTDQNKKISEPSKDLSTERSASECQWIEYDASKIIENVRIEIGECAKNCACSRCIDRKYALVWQKLI